MSLCKCHFHFRGNQQVECQRSPTTVNLSQRSRKLGHTETSINKWCITPGSHGLPLSWRWERQSRVMWRGSHRPVPLASWERETEREGEWKRERSNSYRLEVMKKENINAFGNAQCWHDRRCTATAKPIAGQSSQTQHSYRSGSCHTDQTTITTPQGSGPENTVLLYLKSNHILFVTYAECNRCSRPYSEMLTKNTATAQTQLLA